MLDPLELLPDRRIGHIVAADAADAVLVAPATARWLAAMANGLADDVITATCLATTAPVVVAPAMDGDMYAHPATRANVADAARLRLRDRRARGRAPSRPARSGRAGWPSCRDSSTRSSRPSATGRSAQPDQRTAAADRRAGRASQDLAGWHVVVTAGGTAEPIDPVRFIGNRSSGRMGVAIAEAALARGARVTLIGGTTSVPLPEAATIVAAPTTAAMRDAVLAALPAADALVMAAAVADFRPRSAADDQARPRRRPDPRAGADRGHPGRGLRPRPCRARRGADARRPAPCWSASRPRPARSTAPPRRPPARASTCWSPTMSPSRAPASAPTPTGSPS